MGYFPQRGAVTGRPTPPTMKTEMLQAPSGGINAADPLASLNPNQDCVAMSNMIPDGRGLRVRSGFAEFATNVGSTDIQTVIPFRGTTSSNDKLFVANQTGIYDITAGGAGAWVAAVTFGTHDTTSGYGSWTNFVKDNDVNSVFYADETNGLYRYDEGGSWAVAAGITGVSVANICFVMTWKNRLWMVEKNTGRAWYLAAGAISGAATRFDFGNKFKYGGQLVGLWDWTLDGGNGPNDYLIALSRGGDVVIYSGTDPSSATTFFQVGQYFIGSVPEGRRQAANFGGELFMLSQYGVLPMTGLLAGKSITDANLYASRNISPLIASDMNLYRTQYGWEMRNLPSENVFSVVVPKQPNLPYKQYARSTKTNGWTTFQALTYVTGDTWNGSFYIGGKNGVVYKITGNSDGVAVDGTGGVDVQWTFLSAFSDLGDTGQYHIPAFVRPVFRAAAIPSYGTACRFDYNTDDISLSISAPGASGFLWDAANALWDTALWGADAVTLDPVLGSSGLGRATAVAIQGASHAETQLIRTDLMFQTGGVI